MMKKAVALGYDPELDIAPRVLAKGEGKLAEKIIAIAKEESIPPLLIARPRCLPPEDRPRCQHTPGALPGSSPGVGLGLPA